MSETANTFRAPTPEELVPLFPQYRILSLIATGGMGAVYHAVQISLEREVAIKLLRVRPGKGSQDPGGSTRLLREAQLIVDTRDAMRGVAGDRSKVYGL